MLPRVSRGIRAEQRCCWEAVALCVAADVDEVLVAERESLPVMDSVVDAVLVVVVTTDEVLVAEGESLPVMESVADAVLVVVVTTVPDCDFTNESVAEGVPIDGVIVLAEAVFVLGSEAVVDELTDDDSTRSDTVFAWLCDDTTDTVDDMAAEDVPLNESVGEGVPQDMRRT